MKLNQYFPIHTSIKVRTYVKRSWGEIVTKVSEIAIKGEEEYKRRTFLLAVGLAIVISHLEKRESK